MPGTANASCPNEQVHGNPYKNCPTCSWRQETLVERTRRLGIEARTEDKVESLKAQADALKGEGRASVTPPPGSTLEEVRRLKAEVQATLRDLYAPESAGTHHDVTAPIEGEDPQDRIDRVIRHIQNEHPELDMLDPGWLDHPLVSHEAIHRKIPSDLPRETVQIEARLTDVDLLQVRLQARLSEMLGATLLPIAVKALTLQMSLTTRSWLRSAAYGLPHDSREQLEMLRLAEMAILEPEA